MVHDDADPVTEVAQVARGRGIAGAERVVADAGMLLSLLAQERELCLGVARRRADRREGAHETDAHDEGRHGESERQQAALQHGEDDQPDREREIRGTGVGEEQADVRDTATATVQPGRRRATRKSRTITSTYAVASGLRNVDPSRRIGFVSSPVLNTQFSGSPDSPS